MKALLALPLLLWLLPPSASRPVPVGGDAAALLEKAESRAESGKYREAQRLYKKLAEDFAGLPSTLSVSTPW